MRNLYLIISALVFLSIGFSSCSGSKKLERPEEFYTDFGEDPLSRVNIPIKLDVAALEQSINRQLTGVLYEDDNFNDGDNMKLRAVKQGDIRLQIDSQQIKYQVPLILWIQYDAGITRLEANGDILLDMSTNFEVTPDWRIRTTTELADYQWTREPKLRLGITSVPVGRVLDIFLRNGRSFLTRQIDDLVAESLEPETIVRDIWTQMFQPILVSEEYNTWLVVNPERLAMTPLTARDGIASATIVVESRPFVKLGNRPADQITPPLPPLEQVVGSGEDFFLLIDAEIPFLEAERLAQDQMIGETFESGKRSVTVEDVEIYGSGDKIIVNTTLSGSYNGSVYMEGEPVYNPRRNTIEVKDLNFTLNTQNFLYKSAGWVLKSTIKRRFQESMEFLLDYNIDDMKKQLQEQLNGYSISEEVNLNGQLENLGILNVHLTPESIMVDIGVTGTVEIKVNGLK